MGCSLIQCGFVMKVLKIKHNPVFFVVFFFFPNFEKNDLKGLMSVDLRFQNASAQQSI